jgi:hypothetical protein
MSRSSFELSELDVPGFNQRQVTNKYYRQPKFTGKLSLILPGLGYTCDKPLLYFTTEVLLAKGFDVLQLWADYTTLEFQELTQIEQSRCLAEDSRALLAAGRGANSYNHLVLGGKSIGTLSLSLLLNQEPGLSSATTFWLTPLFYLPLVAHTVKDLQGPAFIAGSDADPTFDTDLLSQIMETPHKFSLVVKGADHSLEIPGDTIKSLQELSRLTENFINFLS